jgi:hypothetical protein
MPPLRKKIKVLDKEINSHFHSIRFKDVKRSIVPGNSQSLWRAVKIARDVNTSALPNQLYFNDVVVSAGDQPDTITIFF